MKPCQRGFILGWRYHHQALQSSTPPVRIVRVRKSAVVGRWSGRAFSFLERNLGSCVSSLSLFLLFRLVAHGGYRVNRAGYGGCGGCGPAFRQIIQAQIFCVMEMLREHFGNGMEFIFDHDVNVVAIQAIMHQPEKHLAFCRGVGGLAYSLDGGVGGGEVEGVRPRSLSGGIKDRVEG